MFNFLKFKKSNIPSLESLRPKIFDVERHWLYAVVIFLACLIAVVAVGFHLFYSVYFETYKKTPPAGSFENLINADRLKSIIQKRNDFINQEIKIPKDPSL